MTQILVVDDSSCDRRLAGALLAKDSEFEVHYACDGAEAVELLRARAFDAVVTDLVMPRMDGLALVEHVRSEHDGLPVVLMTSQGTEEIAVKALRIGAASYVPKRRLAKNLLPSIHSVLDAVRREQDHRQLMNCVADAKYAFELPNDQAMVSSAVGYLQQQCAAMRLFDQSDCMRLGVALEEALTNALFHGNLEIGSELREQDQKRYCELVESRKCEEPFRTRCIYLEAVFSREEAVFRIRDEGPGFDPTTLPDPTDLANLEKMSGRGVFLMRTFTDDVVFNERGNAVTLVKRCTLGREPNGKAIR